MLKTKNDHGKQAPHSTSSLSGIPLLRAIFNALPSPIYFRNCEGGYLSCNQAFLKQVMGYHQAPVAGESTADIKDHLPPDLIKLFKEKETCRFEEPEQQPYEASIHCGDGQRRTYVFHDSIIQDENGKPAGVVSLMLNITAEKTAEGELKQSHDQLEEMVAKRSKELIDINNRLSEEIGERTKAENALMESEERYRSIFENSSAATILIEPDMTISMANAKTEKICKLPRNEFIGHSKILEFITPVHRDRIKLYHELRMKGDKNVPQQFDFQITDGNGNIRDLLANVKWIEETQQTIASLLDITERNLLQKERQKLAAVIDQSDTAVIITDPHGNIEYVNQAFESLSGFDRKECIGKTIEAHFFSDKDRRVFKQMTFMVSGEDSWSGRVENLRRDGRTYIADTRIFPICNERGKAINLVCVKTDVTHEVQLEKQLQHSQKMEAIGTLAGGIAHDFNNILGGILGHAEISMLKAKENEHLKRNLQRILDGCQRAKELVQNILTFSRKHENETKNIELQIIIKEVLKLLRASIPSTIEFKQSISNESSIVCASPTQIHQIVMNLCTNASQAMQKSGGVLEVILKNVELKPAQCEGMQSLIPGPHCLLRVRDTGEGMDMDTSSHIFEPYFTTREQTGGTGLGLSVVHGIVKNYNGAIFVDSSPDEGTTFDVYLPRVGDEIDVSMPVEDSLPGGREHILVADDELFILEIMSDMLSSLGYKVETVNSGNEAIEKFNSAPEDYDLVIADLTMPKITGTMLAVQIKKVRKDIPIILTTGMTFDKEAEAKEFNDFNAILNKPILYNDLAKTIRDVLDKNGHR